MSPPPEDPRWRLERPGAGAEQMFADDPEMLEGVRRARAERDPVQKPWWWIALQLVAGLVGAAATTLGMMALTGGKLPEPLVPLTGLLGGCLVFIGAVGHLPGKFRVVETDERLTLWKPLGAAM